MKTSALLFILLVFVDVISSKKSNRGRKKPKKQSSGWGEGTETTCPSAQDIDDAITTLFNEADDSIWSSMTSDDSYRACWQQNLNCYDKQSELDVYFNTFIPLVSDWQIEYKNIKIGTNYVMVDWSETITTTVENGQCVYPLDGSALFYCDEDGKITERHELWDDEQFNVALAGATNADGCNS